MIVHVETKLFDLSGHLIIQAKPDTTTGRLTRRVNRSATLDGGVAINDQGFAHGDRTVEIYYKPVSKAHDDIARRIVEFHGRVYLTMPDGCYEAAPQEFAPAPEENAFTFYVIAKLNED